MMPPKPIVPQKVSCWELRNIWNNPEFQASLQKRCTQRGMVREELAPPGAEQVPGAMSQVYDLFDNTSDSSFLGTFHQYRNPDGSIGASGKPDPKLLVVNGIPLCDP
jgi:hypothetical protein